MTAHTLFRLPGSPLNINDLIDDIDPRLTDFAEGRAVAHIHHGEQAWFVKRLRLRPYGLWRTLRGKRPSICLWNEAQHLDQLANKNFPSPTPFHYQERQRKNWIEAWLFTHHLDGPLLALADDVLLRETVPAAAALLGRLHTLGWAHGDAHLYNMMLVAKQVYFIDFERCATLTPAGAKQDLGKFLTHVLSRNPPSATVDACIEAYRAAAPEQWLTDDCLAEATRLAKSRKKSRWQAPPSIRL